MTATIQNVPKFYDHALNCSNAADGSAMASARRTAIADGTAYRVEANWAGNARFYWVGCRYDALGLAKSLVANRAENVILTRPNGVDMTVEEIRNARY